MCTKRTRYDFQLRTHACVFVRKWRALYRRLLPPPSSSFNCSKNHFEWMKKTKQNSVSTRHTAAIHIQWEENGNDVGCEEHCDPVKLVLLMWTIFYVLTIISWATWIIPHHHRSCCRCYCGWRLAIVQKCSLYLYGPFRASIRRRIIIY